MASATSGGIAQYHWSICVFCSKAGFALNTFISRSTFLNAFFGIMSS